MERRIAISGLIPARPFTTIDSVRLTPNASKPKRLQTQFLEYLARMRWIVHQHNVTSVVILVVHNLSVLSNEPKRDPQLPLTLTDQMPTRSPASR